MKYKYKTLKADHRCPRGFSFTDYMVMIKRAKSYEELRLVVGEFTDASSSFPIVYVEFAVEFAQKKIEEVKAADIKNIKKALNDLNK